MFTLTLGKLNAGYQHSQILTMVSGCACAQIVVKEKNKTALQYMNRKQNREVYKILPQADQMQKESLQNIPPNKSFKLRIKLQIIFLQMSIQLICPKNLASNMASAWTLKTQKLQGDQEHSSVCRNLKKNI